MNMDQKQAERARDAIVKSMYVELHAWIVRKINDIILLQHSSGSEPHYIGILDMPGFGEKYYDFFVKILI